ncbi:MAG TPA: aminodeoxychorismate synthase component I, partial [Prolixibacteraceae bacterium]|nr:aminodeoxychorismate synthase component I [Prolixibacteraceae bacterium]
AIQKMNDAFRNREALFFAISFDMNHCWAGTPLEAMQSGILFNFNNKKNHHAQPSGEVDIQLQKSPVGFAEYEKSFNAVTHNIKRGNSYLVNLTASTPVKTNANLPEIFHHAKAKYRLLFKNDFVVFSPETFIRITGNEISTYPMKGTIDAGMPNASNIILNSPKEMAEHATIVDLLRNDLSRHATNVSVKRFRYIDTIYSNHKELLQVSSQITGRIEDEQLKNMGNVIFDMLPAGSISGAPKEKTLKIIEQAETHQRGYYTGIAGYYDGYTLDSCVLIRYIENQNGKLVYKSGGGITALSNAKNEYNELIDKIYVPNR